MPQRSASPARDRVALVTGAARGIGAATARKLVARGFRVSLVGLEGHRLRALADEVGGDVSCWFEADVTDQEQLGAAVGATVERFGGLDVVVANAGIASYGTVAQISPDVFRRVIDVNLTGAFRTLHASLPHLIERRGYALIVASMASFTHVGGLAAYSASKAGVDAMAGAVLQEVAHRGVAIGSAHPSWIDTDMVRDASSDLAAFREMRSMLPWPLRSTTSVDRCATALANGIDRRARRIYVPRVIQLLQWLRPMLASPPVERALLRRVSPVMASMEAEVDALGRTVSERVQETQPSGSGVKDA